MVPKISNEGEFQIVEVNPWKKAPILDDIGTFAVPLSTYVLIKHILKGSHTQELDICVLVVYIPCM